MCSYVYTSQWIKGSYTGVVGLPLFELVSVLSDIGVVESG